MGYTDHTKPAVGLAQGDVVLGLGTSEPVGIQRVAPFGEKVLTRNRFFLRRLKEQMVVRSIRPLSKRRGIILDQMAIELNAELLYRHVQYVVDKTRAAQGEEVMG